MFINRAFKAGEPRFNTPDDGAGGSGTPGNEGADNPSGGDNDLFDKGYGKGVRKGREEATKALLKDLGVASLEDLKGSVQTAAEAKEAARKAAEDQGKFKELYEAEKAKVQELMPYRQRYEQIEAQQKTELATITEKLSDADKAIIDGMPIDRALAVAKRLSGAPDLPPIGGKPAGNGRPPVQGGTKDLAFYEKKGYRNLSAEERADCDRLMAEKDSMTIGAMVEAAQQMMPPAS